MKQRTKSVVSKRGEPYPFFKGFHYLVIRITDRLFHINLLSMEHHSAEDLMRLAQVQADANKFEVCLALNENSGVYFLPRSEPRLLKRIPKGGIFITDKLRLVVDQPVTEDFLRRKKELEAFIKRTQPKTGFLIGDIQKGGREANYEELICLRGVQENGLPKGLVVCPVCEDHRGECLDPSPGLSGLIVKVSCYCANDSLCAYCGGKLYNRKPGSNHYEPKDGQIWHTPFFCGLSHKCPGT
jgi:hypothetical protein